MQRACPEPQNARSGTPVPSEGVPSEGLIAAVARLTQNMVAITGDDHRIVWVNRAFEEQIGVTLAEAVGRHPIEFTAIDDEDDRQAFSGQIDEMIEAGGSFDGDVQMRLADGAPRWCHIEIHPAQESPEGPVHYINVWRDVSDQFEPLEKLKAKATENRLHSVVAEKTINTVLVTRPEGEIEWANSAFYDVFGWDEAEILGRRPRDLLSHPDTPADVVQRLRTARRDGENFHGELLLSRKDGGTVNMISEVLAVRDEAGQIERFVTINTDITGHTELARRLEASEAEARRLAVVAEATDNAVYFTNAQNLVTWTNAAFTTITGYQNSEIVGQKIRTLLSGQAADIGAHDRIARRKRAGERFSEEILLERRNGKPLWFLLDFTPLPEGLGEPGGYIVVARDTTESRMSAERLRDAERVAGTGNWHISMPDWQVTWSDGIARIHGLPPGYQPEDMDEVLQYCHPEERPKVKMAIQWAFDNGKGYAGRTRVLRRSGEVRHVDIRVEVEKSPAGKPVAVFGIIQDVTELQAAQNRLKQAEQIARIGHWHLNVRDQAMTWSDEACRICGFIPDETEPSLGLIRQMVHPSDRHVFDEIVKDGMAEPDGRGETLRIRRPDGELRYVRLKPDVERGADGQAMSFIGIIEDVTEQLQTERHIAKAEEIANIGHWRFSNQPERLYWSDQVFRIHGYEPGEFEPTLEKCIDLYHPDDRERFIEIVETSQHRASDVNFVLRIVRTDGETRFIEVRSEPETDGEGGVLGHIGTIQDVTKRIEAEQDLVAEKERAVMGDKAKADFLATMSHEIRTPLNAIIGFSEVMRAETFGPLGDERYSDYMESISQSSQHLLSLLSDILDLSRIDAQGYELDEREFSIDQMLGDCVGMMGGAARDQNIALVGDRSHRFQVRADERALKQIVLNLLSNAIKFTGHGGTITLRSELTEDGNCSISVQDTGIGIPAAALQRVLEPFKQARSAQVAGAGGAGIGLALSKRLIELHDGMIEIASQEGEGTSVTIIIPASRVIASETSEGAGFDWPRATEEPARLRASVS